MGVAAKYSQDEEQVKNNFFEVFFFSLISNA